MKLNQYKLKTRKKSLKNNKTLKVLVKKVKKTNKRFLSIKKVGGVYPKKFKNNNYWIKGKNSAYIPLNPEEISAIIKLFEEADFENLKLGLHTEFDEKCNNPLLQKSFGSKTNCEVFFVNSIKKVSFVRELINNNPTFSKGLNDSQKKMIITKFEQTKCILGQNNLNNKDKDIFVIQNNLNNKDKDIFVDFINKVYGVSNILDKLKKSKKLFASQNMSENKKKRVK